MNFQKIDFIFEQIMLGNPSVITSDNIRVMNDRAMKLYEIPQLDTQQVECLKKIIMICNVLYNRTDMTILPIEDGFYDLLLEKYKTYNKHFQVGSAVIEFRNFIENDLDNPRKIAKSPVTFITPLDKRDETHQFIFDELMRKGKPILNQDDYRPNPPLSDNTSISKRTHNTVHNHPTLVGTLDKAKFVLNQDAINAGVFNDDNVKILERDFFQKHINDGIINPNQEIEVVVELKYDGISVEADCDTKVISARTRGDTGIGEAADITPILDQYLFKHADCMKENPVGVKFEAIMTKSNLEVFNNLRGRSYANCRSAIVGLFGASDAYLYRDLITLIPLAVDREDLPALQNRLEEIEFLNSVFTSHGEPLRYCYFKGSVTEVLFLIKAFWEEAKVARDFLNFMYDGIVVSYIDETIRNKLGRVNYINKFSMAVKFDPLEKQTIFRGYTYEVGQHGNITPMIHYDPVEFMGTIHNKSTGSSFKRFQDLGLKYGDIINVEYRNDVMPYVSRLECSHNRDNKNPIIPIIKNCPICGSELVVSDSGKTLLCPNLGCKGRSTQRMVNMFQKMNIKGFAEATVKALNLTHLYEVKDMSQEMLINTLGDADGRAFYQTIQSLMTDKWQDYIIMGSLGFTNIARKKWQAILSSYTISELYGLCLDHSGNRLYTILLENVQPAAAQVIANEFVFFVKDIEFILENMNIIDTKAPKVYNPYADINIRFSGCRNLNLTQLLSSQGVDIDPDSTVTKKTDILLIPYIGYNSKKTAKAEKYDTKMIVMSDFEKDPETYMNQILSTK